jgi:hypothetical protein
MQADTHAHGFTHCDQKDRPLSDTAPPVTGLSNQNISSSRSAPRSRLIKPRFLRLLLLLLAAVFTLTELGADTNTSERRRTALLCPVAGSSRVLLAGLCCWLPPAVLSRAGACCRGAAGGVAALREGSTRGISDTLERWLMMLPSLPDTDRGRMLLLSLSVLLLLSLLLSCWSSSMLLERLVG